MLCFIGVFVRCVSCWVYKTNDPKDDNPRHKPVEDKRRIAIIGLAGSGKTTLGRILSGEGLVEAVDFDADARIARLDPYVKNACMASFGVEPGPELREMAFNDPAVWDECDRIGKPV